LTRTQYAYKDSGGLVSYDDEQAICDKTQYVSNLCITSLSANSVGMTNLVTTNSFNLHSVLITI
jgi:GH18 family chitinase